MTMLSVPVVKSASTETGPDVADPGGVTKVIDSANVGVVAGPPKSIAEAARTKGRAKHLDIIKFILIIIRLSDATFVPTHLSHLLGTTRAHEF